MQITPMVLTVPKAVPVKLEIIEQRKKVNMMKNLESITASV